MHEIGWFDGRHHGAEESNAFYVGCRWCRHRLRPRRHAGKNKQGVDAQAAADLEAATKEFADMFWATKK